jgi:ribose 5-phosphate isomerase B
MIFFREMIFGEMILENNFRIFIASDHAGFFMKKYLIENFNGGEICDLGTTDSTPCDYPIFAHKLVTELLNYELDCELDKGDARAVGVLLCSTGIGMSIASNRNIYIRAALCFNEEMAMAARRHNDANIIVFGASIIDNETALKCLRLFLSTDFEAGRHARRLDLIRSLGK